jgi:hypothetical protein
MLGALDGSRGVSFLKINARMLNASHVRALRTPEWETRLAVPIETIVTARCEFGVLSQHNAQGLGNNIDLSWKLRP